MATYRAKEDRWMDYPRDPKGKRTKPVYGKAEAPCLERRAARELELQQASLVQLATPTSSLASSALSPEGSFARFVVNVYIPRIEAKKSAPKTISKYNGQLKHHILPILGTEP